MAASGAAQDSDPTPPGAESVHALEQFFSRALELFVITDHEMRLRRVNPAWERTLGYPLDELIGRSYMDFVHPDDREATAAVAQSLHEGEDWHEGFENRYVCRDGGARTLRWSTVLGREEGLIYAVATDVTELRSSQEQRRHSEDLLERGEELAALGSWHLDLRTMQWRWSQGLLRITGLEPERFDPSHEFTLGFLHPEDREWVEGELSRLVGGEHPVRARYRWVRADGEVRVVDTVADLELDDHGRPSTAYGITIDITERTRAEQEARRLESELQQSQRLETVGRLAGGVAHDFNNLLSVIINNAALAADELPAGAVGRTELDEVARAAGRAAELTHQLLLFSRQESVEPEVLDPNDVVRQVERLLRRTIGEDIELRVALSADVPSIEVDRGQLERVVVNLAVNARDAMPSGGTLEVATETAEPSRARSARIRVADTGHGMSDEVAARAFEPFFTTKPIGEGSGLGLATVYGIVSQAGGEVELRPRPGGGTEAIVTLPAATAPPAAGYPSKRPASAEGGATILVVEDEPSVRRLIVRLLRSEGYSVHEAVGPTEALAATEDRSGPIDLLLTDVVMPTMSGRQLAERLAETIPGLTVLYTSGYTDDVVVRHGVVREEVPFVAKPFNRDSLLRAVGDALAARAGP